MSIQGMGEPDEGLSQQAPETLEEPRTGHRRTMGWFAWILGPVKHTVRGAMAESNLSPVGNAEYRVPGKLAANSATAKRNDENGEFSGRSQLRDVKRIRRVEKI